ncbi:MAG: tRNA (N6-threonylcarbamoyladenosine(37)-N6)-methyltransferase TrmO [Bdellovibrionota bacterium]
MMKTLTNIETPFHQKFGIPRQPLLVREAWGKMVFPKENFYVEAFRGIEKFSHLWLIFQFHSFKEEKVSSLVSPPRFDGQKKLGVFATRSPFRPNHMGLSVVEFDRLEVKQNSIELWVRGVDLLNGTPIYDIKPYIPYCDSIPDARAEMFEEKPKMHEVIWEVEAPPEKAMIEKVIAMDPRPGHYKFLDREHAILIADWNVKFRLVKETFVIHGVEKNPALT